MRRPGVGIPVGKNVFVYVIFRDTCLKSVFIRATVFIRGCGKDTIPAKKYICVSKKTEGKNIHIRN